MTIPQMGKGRREGHSGVAEESEIARSLEALTDNSLSRLLPPIFLCNRLI